MTEAEKNRLLLALEFIAGSKKYKEMDDKDYCILGLGTYWDDHYFTPNYSTKTGVLYHCVEILFDHITKETVSA